VAGALASPLKLTHITRDEGQEYVCLGSRAVSYRDPERYPLLVLSTLLGGGMSSRLFQQVREERGLAYSIFSYLDCFAETGLLATGLALKPEWTREALEVISQEFRRLRSDGLRPGELASAKAQLRGSTLLGMESTSNRMTRLGRSEFYYGRQVPLSEVLGAIEAVTAEEVERVAQRVLAPEVIALVLVGPLAQGEIGPEVVA
jgi:predicted Zn-dependent peptidase